MLMACYGHHFEVFIDSQCRILSLTAVRGVSGTWLKVDDNEPVHHITKYFMVWTKSLESFLYVDVHYTITGSVFSGCNIVFTSLKR